MSSDTSNFEASPGMQATQDAVSFINNQVLQPDVKPIQGTAKPMADQSAAMMLEDMRSFLQSNEQVMLVAIAQAAKLATNPETVEEGAIAMNTITSALEKLPTYAESIGDAASHIVNTFNGDTSQSKESPPDNSQDDSNPPPTNDISPTDRSRHVNMEMDNSLKVDVDTENQTTEASKPKKKGFFSFSRNS
ncbi:MAG: hypothetical protein OXE99_10040 [Cellvibrionales bacterium]|nr:hypothetical protein [Cellvibrionales bacterium]